MTPWSAGTTVATGGVPVSTTAGCIGTDLLGRVTFWSVAAERMLGYSRQEMVGRTLPRELFDPAQLEERAAQLGCAADLRLLTVDPARFDRRSARRVDLGAVDRRADDRRRAGTKASRSTQGQHESTWTMVHKSGQRLDVSLRISSVRSSTGEHTGYIGMGTDVSLERRTHDVLVEALEREAAAGARLRELDAAKDAFLATVSHELRTPLTSIHGFTELLEDGADALTEAQREHLGAVRRNADRLRALVEDLLTLSSMDSGTLEPATRQVDLREVVSRADEQLRSALVGRRLGMTLRVPAAPVMVSGDAQQLTRALSNLLANAVKFTEDGGAVACVLTSSAGTASVTVADTGIGIPVEEQAQLFTRFFRSTTSQRRETQGSGLGLAIAAELVRNHGGEISVVSEHGTGAQFTISLPLSTTAGMALQVAS